MVSMERENIAEKLDTLYQILGEVRVSNDDLRHRMSALEIRIGQGDKVIETAAPVRFSPHLCQLWLIRD